MKVLFSKDKPTDVQQVHKAAVWLGVGEFQLFCDAWHAWYNEKPSEKRIEPHFVNFLGRDVVPFWVRNYVRNILDSNDLLAKEKKRLAVGVLTYYIPLLLFFILIMRALL
jgi:hypothetical protein